LLIKKSVPKGFLANKVHRIYKEYILDIIFSTELSEGKGMADGMLKCNKNFPQHKKIIRKEKIYAS